MAGRAARARVTPAPGDQLALPGPPLTVAAVASLLGVTPRYIRKLIQAGALDSVRLPNAGSSGRPELGHLRVPRAEVRLLAARLGVLQPEQWEQPEQAEQRHAHAGAARARPRRV